MKMSDRGLLVQSVSALLSRRITIYMSLGSMPV